MERIVRTRRWLSCSAEQACLRDIEFDTSTYNSFIDLQDKLHQNIAVYTHSGSAPCVQAGKGERVIGLGFSPSRR